MFTSAYKANRVTTTALSVTYQIDRHYETVSGVMTYWWKVTRKAVKDYKFVDMTETAAVKAAAYKVAKYTRSTRKCISRTLDKTCNSCTSTIQPKRNDCGSWDVEINVLEEDSTHSATFPTDPASLFTTENARDYDEGEGGIEITSCTWDGTLVINGTLSGILVGAPATDIKLMQGGTAHTATVVKNSTSAFTITAANWPSTDTPGTVAVCGVSAEWEFTAPTITLTSDGYVEDWEPGTVRVHLDETATLDGSISAGDLAFLYSDDGGSTWEDFTDLMTITTSGSTVHATYTFTSYATGGSFRAKVTAGSVTSNVVTITR